MDNKFVFDSSICILVGAGTGFLGTGYGGFGGAWPYAGGIGMGMGMGAPHNEYYEHDLDGHVEKYEHDDLNPRGAIEARKYFSF